MTVVAVGSALVGLGLLAAYRGDGHGGEPFAVTAIDRAPQVPPDRAAAANTAAATPVAALAAAALPSPAPALPVSPLSGPAIQDVEFENGVKVVRSIRNGSSGAVVLKVPQTDGAGLSVAPDPRLVESSASGPLPKVAGDGSRAADVYARPAEPSGGKPRIAIVVGGMGLDRAETTRARTLLPSAVTFGFAPYGPELDAQVRQARETGHEVLLELPMEDFGRSGAALSHLLLAMPQGNEERLHWLMGRFAGYAGVGNYLGGRLLGDEAALQPLLREIAARGLYFFDDGTAARSLAPSLAADIGLPAVRADVVIDAKSDPASILAALGRLEALARDRGFAVGAATGLPQTDSTISRYLADIGRRGVSLVPVSQLAKTEPRSAARNGATEPAAFP